MELTQFTQAIARMTSDDIHLIAVEIDAHRASTADEIAWWQATLRIDKSLKEGRRCRTAAMAALQAAKTVQAIATAAGRTLPDTEVTTVARAAAEIARGFTAGAGAEPAVSRLLVCWAPLLGRVSVAA
jgi:hypothetical protein